MPVLLDSCVLIDVERGLISAGDVGQLTEGQRVFLSPVSVAELRMGAELSREPAERQRRFASLARMEDRPVLPIDRETGLVFGALAGHIQRAGGQHRRRVQDLWLASQAIQHDCALLTRNEADFSGLPGLKLLTYRLTR